MNVHPLFRPAIAAGREIRGGLVLAIPLVGEPGGQQIRRIVPPLEQPRGPGIEPRRLAERDVLEMARPARVRPDADEHGDQEDRGDGAGNPPTARSGLGWNELHFADYGHVGSKNPWLKRAPARQEPASENVLGARGLPAGETSRLQQIWSLG